MAYGGRRGGLSPGIAFFLGGIVVALALGVLGYLYYQRTHRDILKIEVPGVRGEISKDKGIDGVNIEPQR